MLLTGEEEKRKEESLFWTGLAAPALLPLLLFLWLDEVMYYCPFWAKDMEVICWECVCILYMVGWRNR